MLFLYLLDLLVLENINKNQVENVYHLVNDNCFFLLKYLLELSIYPSLYDQYLKINMSYLIHHNLYYIFSVFLLIFPGYHNF